MSQIITSGPFTGLQQNGYALMELDPAWSWVNYSGKGSAPHRTADEPYPVMTLDEMKALPVADLAAKNCLMHMWVIGSHLDQAIELGRHYGFTYKSDGLVWVKTGKHDPNVRPISMGKWVRKQVEYGLIFTRGKPTRLDAGVRQLIEAEGFPGILAPDVDNVIYAPKREHSRKPDERYERLERLAAGPRVELFGRQHRAGWDVWGNDTRRFNLDVSTLAHVDDFDSILGCSPADEPALEDIITPEDLHILGRNEDAALLEFLG